jgi:capsular exopolysaccharide synthesis family protein
VGEIADALRRARDERGQGDGPKPTQDVDPNSIAPHPTPQPPSEPERQVDTQPRPPVEPQPPSDEQPAPPPAPFADAERLVIPRAKTGSWVARMVVVERGGGAEAYRHFGLRVRRELDAVGHRSVMIVSALREEGKTTTACNLALALTSMAGGRRIALVDLDLRRPSIGTSFGMRPQRGIDSVLYGDATLDEVCVQTDLHSLDLFPVGSPVHNPHELLAGPPLVHLMQSLHESYDLVVVDSPPILLVPDTGLIMPQVGGCIAVLRARKTRRQSFKQMLAMLPPHKLIGTLVNEAHMPNHTKQYGYYLHDEEPVPTEAV